MPFGVEIRICETVRVSVQRHPNSFGMDAYEESPSRGTRKRSDRIKYVKLDAAKKLEIIKYWGKHRVSIATLTERFSRQFDIELRYRGIAEIISYWKENGKVRGSKTPSPCHDIVSELEGINATATSCGVRLTSEDLRQYISCIAFRPGSHVDLARHRGHPLEDHEYAFLQNKCNAILESFSNPIPIPHQFVPSLSTEEVLPYLSSYPPSSVYELDFTLLLSTYFLYSPFYH